MELSPRTLMQVACSPESNSAFGYWEQHLPSSLLESHFSYFLVVNHVNYTITLRRHALRVPLLGLYLKERTQRPGEVIRYPNVSRQTYCCLLLALQSTCDAFGSFRLYRRDMYAPYSRMILLIYPIAKIFANTGSVAISTYTTIVLHERSRMIDGNWVYEEWILRPVCLSVELEIWTSDPKCDTTRTGVLDDNSS
jgi:hypothetical protein